RWHRQLSLPSSVTSRRYWPRVRTSSRLLPSSECELQFAARTAPSEECSCCCKRSAPVRAASCPSSNGSGQCWQEPAHRFRDRCRTHSEGAFPPAYTKAPRRPLTHSSAISTPCKPPRKSLKIPLFLQRNPNLKSKLVCLAGKKGPLYSRGRCSPTAPPNFGA